MFASPHVRWYVPGVGNRYTGLAFRAISAFDAGVAACRLLGDDRCLPFVREVCAHWSPRPGFPLCAECGNVCDADTLFWRCRRCFWAHRDPTFDLLWGLAYGALHAPASGQAPPVHAALDASLHAAVRRLFGSLYDVLGGAAYSTLGRMVDAAYVLVFPPDARAFRMPACTCGHPADAHGTRTHASGFFEAPACISGCACPYYRAAPAAG